MKKFELLLLVSLLVISGAGCRKTPQTPTQANSYVPLAYLPPPPPPETENQINLRELNDGIQAFQNLRTYRAKIQIDTKTGDSNGVLDVVKPDRFRGVITSPDEKQNTELIGVGETVYIRTTAGSWVTLKTNAASKSITEAFRSAMNGNGTSMNKLFSDQVIVTKSENASKGCTNYHISDDTKTEVDANLNICLYKGLPKMVEASNEQGSVSVDYYDFNKLFTIERPVSMTN